MKHYLIIALSIFVLTACGHKIVGSKNNVNMNKIKFIPKEFENIAYDSLETVMCPCSPNFPHEINEVNILKINIPEKIIFHASNENFIPNIPICIAYSISILRALKYNNFSKEIFQIKPEDGDIVYSGILFNKRATHKTPYILDTSEYKQQRINDAQKLNDTELDEGAYSRGYLNVNALDYIQMPIGSGKYEIWVTYYGLESNRMIVEIVLEK